MSNDAPPTLHSHALLQLATAERIHSQQLREATAALQAQAAATLAMAMNNKEEAHKLILAESLSARDSEHQKMLDAALKQQEDHHVQRTQLLLQQVMIFLRRD